MSDGEPIYDKALLEPVKRTFSLAVKKYGANPKAVAWSNKERQFRRFQIFAGLFALATQKASFIVNDLGCGYGAMFAAFKDLPVFRNAQYFGYDISAEMLIEAKRQLPDPRATWIQSHIATALADFSFVSGTYNLNMEADEELWRMYVEDNLRQLWSKTQVALGFNMLSIHSPKRQKTLYYGDPEYFINFCSKEMNGRVHLVDRLAPAEFVIFVIRQNDL